MCFSNKDSSVLGRGLKYIEVNLNHNESVFKKSVCRIAVRLMLPNGSFWEKNQQEQKDSVKHHAIPRDPSANFRRLFWSRARYVAEGNI